MTKVFIELSEIDITSSRFIDTRFILGEPSAGYEAFKESHVSGAVYWDLEKDLSDMDDFKGRHPMISKEKMIELVQNSGLNLDDKIIIYDQGEAPFALRAYFLLEWAGFKNVRVIRQSFEMIKQQLPITDEVTQYTKSNMTPLWNDEIYLTMDEVRDIANGKRDGQLIDARSSARYRGEIEPIDHIAGHIPTAINYDWEQLKRDGAFLEQELMESQLSNLSNKDKPVIAYCGSGVTAAPLYASLKEAGYKDVKLYVGSYSDWIRENDVEKSN
ncbi:sulfurtransferase [Psychrobacillus sp. FSL K6-2684]|uniref:sulfurtransferase n=1 Tax=Psychrobacillus sp. FSL K6-2684 TaxID=2921547 RepID=UPI0030F81807